MFFLDNNLLGEKLLKIRLDNNLSKSKVSKQIKTSHSYITDIESGKFIPSLTKILDISSTLNLSYLSFKDLFKTYLLKTSLSLEDLKLLSENSYFQNLMLQNLNNDFLNLFSKINKKEKYLFILFLFKSIFYLNNKLEPDYDSIIDRNWNNFFKYLDYFKLNNKIYNLSLVDFNKTNNELFKTNSEFSLFNHLFINNLEANIFDFNDNFIKLHKLNKAKIEIISSSSLMLSNNKYIHLVFILNQNLNEFYSNFTNSKGDLLLNKYKNFIKQLNTLPEQDFKLKLKQDIYNHLNSYIGIINQFKKDTKQ